MTENQLIKMSQTLNPKLCSSLTPEKNDEQGMHGRSCTPPRATRDLNQNACICMCIYIYIYTYIHTYMHTYKHTYTCIYIPACFKETSPCVRSSGRLSLEVRAGHVASVSFAAQAPAAR